MEKGDIWEIFYYTVKKVEISDEDRQKFIDRQTREFGNVFNPPSGLTSDQYSALFLNHFMKSRNESRDLIESSEIKIRHRSLFQVGNLECFNDVIKIESSPDFDRWENPSIVLWFKELSSNYL